MCEECTKSGKEAEAFCHQCVIFICEECTKSHKEMSLFSSHEIVSLTDLKQGQAREIVTKELPTKKCDVHEEPLVISCFDCIVIV